MGPQATIPKRETYLLHLIAQLSIRNRMEFSAWNEETPMSENAESRYIGTHEYAPGSGRLQIPYFPDTDPNGYNDNAVEPVGPSSHRFPEGEFVSPGFFQTVDLSAFVLPKRELDWKYDRRREAQAILPFLYLGPWSFLTNRAWLREEGITLLLAVRDIRQARLVSGQKAAADLGIEADSVDVLSNQQLVSVLPQVIRRINDHISSPTYSDAGGAHLPSPKKVLVFCETGNGLSAMVVVAYLMVMFNLELGHALQVVNSQRFCTDIDDMLRPFLMSFESILEAKRDVETAKKSTIGANSGLAVPAMSLAKKRSFTDQMEIEDLGDASADMEDLYAGRQAMAPFQDRW